MPDALIGATGFVGTTLLKSAAFDAHYRSTDIATIEGRRFGTVVCAGAPAQKWIANREPEADRAGIDKLIGHLDRIECDTFVLVSTVDVFGVPVDVDEDSPVVTAGLHAYGRHRFELEEFVRRRFARHLVARLPGLVGPGLRKNAIHDLRHEHEVAKIDSRGVFQFYPMVNLWFDLQAALAAGLSLVHLTAEPVSVADIARLGFGRDFDNPVAPSPARYDMRSRHASVFGGRDGYQYSARETIQAVRHYAQSEPARAED
jgi:nucleoside-diphosphate-sugar epimerase